MRKLIVAIMTVGAGAVLAASAIPAMAASSSPNPAPAAEGRASTTANGLEEPLVLAHRGASGYRPEHTIAAYELAVAQGADYIEPDLVSTKDGVLVDRHEPEISGTSDVASHPEFAGRRATKVLDGVPTTGWFTEDFTLAELKSLRAKERLPQVRQENTIYDGRYEIPTFEEVLKLREALSKKYDRTIGIIPEIKHSTYQHANLMDPERELMRLVTAYGLNKKDAPLWVQSFELGNLVRLRTDLGYKANSVFLATNGGAPYDLVAAQHPRTYSDLLKADSLKELSAWINGIGPDKGLVIPRTADGILGQPTTLVADAHAAGLTVTPWTFRAENTFLPADYQVGSNPADYGRIIDEVVTYLRTGVDGVFCDQPDICVVARDQFLAR
jgi:glycerophosphoryl diester phosphodiesterase